MAIGVNTRIEDLQHVSTLYGKCLLHYKTCAPNLLIFFCFCCPGNQVSCLMAGLLCGRTNLHKVLLDHVGCLDGNLAQLALSPLSFSFNLLICWFKMRISKGALSRLCCSFCQYCKLQGSVHASCIWQTSDSSWEFPQKRKCARKNSSKHYSFGLKKIRETTTGNLCVKIMNSKWQVKGKLGHVIQICICHLM